MCPTFSLFHSVPTVPCPSTPPGILNCSPGCFLMEVQCPPPSVPTVPTLSNTTWDTDLFSWMFPHGSAMSPTFSLYHSVPTVPPPPPTPPEILTCSPGCFLMEVQCPPPSPYIILFQLYHPSPPYHLGYRSVLLDVSSWKCNNPHLLLISFSSNCTLPPHTTWDTDLFSWMYPHGSAMSPTFSLYHSVPTVPPLPPHHLGY